MIKLSIARRYARALFDLVGAEAGPTAERLTAFADLVTQSPELAEVLSNPAFSAAERTRVLGRLREPLALDRVLERFLQLLIDRHRVAYLPAITGAFRNLVDEAAGRMRVEIESATALDEESVAALRAALVAGLGHEVVLGRQVEPALLAGVAVHIGGLVVDGSLRTQLDRLKQSLARKRA